MIGDGCLLERRIKSACITWSHTDCADWLEKDNWNAEQAQAISMLKNY